MPCKNTTQAYGSGTRFLHWLVFLLIALQYAFAITMVTVSSDKISGIFYTLHKSLGIVIFFVALIYVLWIWSSVKPNWPSTMPAWERLAARSVHALLCWLMVLMPLSGWILSSAAGYAPNFFWWFKLPLPWVPISKPLASTMGLLHEIFAWALGVLVFIHILAALKHHFIDKDKVLCNMVTGSCRVDES